MTASNIRREIVDLISINERIQSTVLMGETFHDDERERVRNKGQLRDEGVTK
jgi:hypothetical protein